MKLFLALFALIYSFSPTIVSAAQLVPVQCANPATCGSCELVSMINNVLKFIIELGTLAAVGVFIYAGFLMVTSKGEPGQISKAKGLFTNVVIGLVIILSAFLIVNTIIAGLVKSGSPIYRWQTIECVYPKAPRGLLDTSSLDNNGGFGLIGDGVGAGAGSGGGTYSGPLSQCNPRNSSCSVASLLAAGYSQTQANIMSCIAMTESSGVASIGPYNERHGGNSSACGLFQITKTTWNANQPSGSCSDWRSNCQNAECNAQVARSLVQRNGYSDWTCPGCNNKAQACINRYSGG